jgi:osmotically-inducible protein OsmY
MRNAILLLGALALAACSKDKTPEPATSAAATGTAMPSQPTMITAEEVRTTLIQDRPASRESINNLTIMSDGGYVTLRGTLDDEQTRSDVVNRVRSMPNVRGVRDELSVMPKAAAAPSPMDTRGTTAAGAMGSKSDAVRKQMQQAQPQSMTVIEALTITEEGTQDVRLSGTVPNEDTKKALVKAAKDTPGVKNVKDDLKVSKKAKQQQQY